MATVQELLRAALDLPGDSPARDTEILLCHCLGKPRSYLYAWSEQVVAEGVRQQFESLMARRRAGSTARLSTRPRDSCS